MKVIKLINLPLETVFVMSAAADNLDNNIKKRIERFSALVQGGIGLIISGGIRAHQIEEWSEVTEVIHKNGGKIAIQIVTEKGPGILLGTGANEDHAAVSILPENSSYFHSYLKYGRAACISCNKCITELLAKNQPLECCLDKQVRQESETF